MTLEAWLDGRTPPPPPALGARVRELLVDDLDAGADEVPRRCLDVAERVLAGLLDAPAGSRGAALDLLAADALVTYALEAASEDLECLDEVGTAALMRLSATAERGGAP